MAAYPAETATLGAIDADLATRLYYPAAARAFACCALVGVGFADADIRTLARRRVSRRLGTRRFPLDCGSADLASFVKVARNDMQEGRCSFRGAISEINTK